jgi:hypothetical protein
MAMEESSMIKRNLIQSKDGKRTSIQEWSETHPAIAEEEAIRQLTEGGYHVPTSVSPDGKSLLIR